MIGFVVLSLVVAVGVTGAVHAYGRRRLLDHPNARSSHTRPVPRGGGMGPAVAVLLCGLVMGWHATLPGWWPVFGAMALVALAGWMDDHRPLPVTPRIVAHLVAGILVGWTAWQGGLFLGLPALVAVIWWVFWTVSAINVLNFMDGIDGLVASQAVVFGVYLALLAPGTSPAEGVALSVAAAWGGFLLWNWPPSRIFMGDVGSGALGVLVVGAGVFVMMVAESGLVRTFLPMLPLFLDAAITIAARLHRGESLTTPHRTHLYQRLANGGWGHARVTVSYLAAAVMAATIGVLAPAVWVGLAALGYGVLLVVMGRLALRTVT